MIKFKYIAVLLILSAATLSAGCGVGEASVADEKPAEAVAAVPVEVAYPERADVFATYNATTTIASDADAPVAARASGEIVELLAEEGDWVQEGQILAKLDGERLRLEMLSAKADLAKARGEFQRYVDLNKRGLVSESMFDGLKYDVAAFEATYELKKLNYEYSNIRAPIAGVVSVRHVKPGQNIEINDFAFRITNPRELLAYLQIPQSELAKFSAGHSASLTVDAMPDEQFPATIARISPTIDVRNGTFRATAFIDNEAGDLAPGMFAKFTIAYEKHEGAMLIPTDALVLEDDATSVYVASEGTVSRRVITTGIQTGNRTEVLDGLNDDDQVVVIGHGGLRDGASVLASNSTRQSNTG